MYVQSDLRKHPKDIVIKSAKYFVQKTETAVIYKTTHQSGLRKHPKDTLLVQMRAEQKKERKKSFKTFPSLSFESVECNCYKKQLPLYTHKKSQTKGDKKKRLIIITNIYPNC